MTDALARMLERELPEPETVPVGHVPCRDLMVGPSGPVPCDCHRACDPMIDPECALWIAAEENR